MKMLESLPDPSGLYALNPKGELWFYDGDRRYRLDVELTRALSAHIRNFLAYHREHPDACRLGVVSPARESRSWQGPTLLLDEKIVRVLYPAGRGTNKGLTAFQKNNCEKSIYRGMELLLRHRKANAPDSPVYCPILFDRFGAENDCDAPASGELSRGEGVRMLAIDVLDLNAVPSSGNRPGMEWQRLHQKLLGDLIHEGKRATSRFEIMDRFEWTEEFEEELDRLHKTERFEHVERWLDMPAHAVDPEQLRHFVHFRNVDPKKLVLFASKCLVYKAPAGVRLFDVGMSDSWNFYLLDGTVTLATDGIAMAVVKGKTEKSTTPISFLKPRKYAVTTLTEVSFIWVHDVLLQAVLKDAAKLPPAAPSNLCA